MSTALFVRPLELRIQTAIGESSNESLPILQSTCFPHVPGFSELTLEKLPWFCSNVAYHHPTILKGIRSLKAPTFHGQCLLFFFQESTQRRILSVFTTTPEENAFIRSNMAFLVMCLFPNRHETPYGYETSWDQYLQPTSLLSAMATTTTEPSPYHTETLPPILDYFSLHGTASSKMVVTRIIWINDVFNHPLFQQCFLTSLGPFRKWKDQQRPELVKQAIVLLKKSMEQWTTFRTQLPLQNTKLSTEILEHDIVRKTNPTPQEIRVQQAAFDANLPPSIYHDMLWLYDKANDIQNLLPEGVPTPRALKDLLTQWTHTLALLQVLEFDLPQSTLFGQNFLSAYNNTKTDNTPLDQQRYQWLQKWVPYRTFYEQFNKLSALPFAHPTTSAFLSSLFSTRSADLDQMLQKSSPTLTASFREGAECSLEKKGDQWQGILALSLVEIPKDKDAASLSCCIRDHLLAQLYTRLFIQPPTGNIPSSLFPYSTKTYLLYIAANELSHCSATTMPTFSLSTLSNWFGLGKKT
jgi:hypothetical protein